MAQVTKMKVIFADDHPMMRDGIRNNLTQIEGVSIVAEAENGNEALRFVENLACDILILDLDMPGIGGMEVTEKVKKSHPDLKIIILTMHDEKEMVKLMLEKGADGYLLKSSSAEELAIALQRVYDGQKHFSSEVTMALLQPDSEAENHDILQDLTEREIEVLKLISEGLSNKEIGEKLFISHRTVDTHRTNLMRKLDVNNVAGLIRVAFKAGLVED